MTAEEITQAVVAIVAESDCNEALIGVTSVAVSIAAMMVADGGETEESVRRYFNFALTEALRDNRQSVDH